MSPLNTFSFMVSSLALLFALGCLMMIFWHDFRKVSNQFLGILLIAASLWNGSALLVIVMNTVNPQSPLLNIAFNLLSVGFVSSAIAIYAFTAVVVQVLSNRFRAILLISWFALILYQIATLQFNTSLVSRSPRIAVPTAFYLVFTASTVYLFWRYRLRIPSLTMRVGIGLFLAGNAISLLNLPTATGPLAISTSVSSIATMLIGISILRQEIIIPLKERKSQVEAMHTMTLAITSQLTINVVLSQIAQQTADRLDADAVAVFLTRGNTIELATAIGLPESLVKTVIPSQNGVVRRVIDQQQTIQLENYQQDWDGEDDLPFATETFGSLVCVPLIYAENVIGALMVIAGKRKHAFQPDNIDLLEMLGTQAAVAITHGQLFTQQQVLASEIETARNQLETVLSSTENPVIAVNRRLEKIFANAAAVRLFPSLIYTHQPVTEILPAGTLPQDYITVYRDIRRQRVHVYEIAISERTYLSHIAALGRDDGIHGWVIVLNDVTDLKELDRLKSEMVRMTSHDLKNPLQAALANLDLLTESLEGVEDEDVSYSLTTIETQLIRMNRIISGVLDVEQVRGGVQSVATCQPEDILESAMHDMQHLARNKSIMIHREIRSDLPMIRGDYTQLERALANIIENAIKFTPKDGNIHLSVENIGDNILFQITDDGIGIPQQAQSRVFDSFFRANQERAKHITGTGLGLHLVKTIVENHKGKIWLESEENIGTTFFVSIPIYTQGIVTVH